MTIVFKYNKYNLGEKPSIHIRKLIPFLKKSKIDNILDFGCGNGRNSFFLKNKKFNISAIDSKMIISKYKKNLIKNKIPFESYNTNSTKIPYKTNSFDAVIAWRVLHRGLKKYRSNLVKDLGRIIKNNGYLIVAVSTDRDIKLDMKRRTHKELEKNTFEYISKGNKTSRHYYTKNEILSGRAFPGFKVISINEFKEKTGHQDKNYFRYYWKVILQKK